MDTILQLAWEKEKKQMLNKWFSRQRMQQMSRDKLNIMHNTE
jgi:hypothetical protein